MRKICFLDETGGAVVEVALLSLLVVPMVFYATFFFDLSLVNIRVSEAARYAAWELTVMEISDWKDHTHRESPNVRGELWKSILKPEVEGRWGDDMNSATSTSNSASGLFHPDNIGGGKSGLTITKIKNFKIGPDNGDLPTYSPYAQEVTADEGVAEPEDSFGTNIRNIIGNVTSFIYDWLGFNKNGFVKLHGSVELEFIKAAPLFKGESLLPGTPIVRANEGLLVDAWDFKDAGDIDYNGYGQNMPEDDGGGEKYYNQVKHMVFAGMAEAVSDWLPSNASSILNGLFRNPFLPTVRSYAMTGTTDASVKFGKDRIDGLASEEDSWGNAPDKFYTNVFKESYNEQCENCNYNAVYKKNGGYYMGCDKPQIDDRQDCWQN